ncbi:extracellular solute-binding protein [Cellulomonas sp. NPDC089187]|uniref:extracellular solute-binding protein n=1 Tax=Cellulomonas sp. NPDC089187 TaxID=3154970 RepID=UPI00341BD692
MTHRRFAAGAGLALAAVLTLTACGGSGSGNSGGDSSADGSTTITMAGWDLAKTPEFNALAEGFNAQSDDVKIEVVEYPSGDDYVTAMTTDIAAGTASDIVMMKQNTDFIRFSGDDLLLDVSDVADGLDPQTGALDVYQTDDGQTLAVPFRNDFWVVYYNKDLFDQAGVEYPDGSWTWDDYQETAQALKDGGLPDGAYPVYQHTWQSTVQGFAQAQTPGADILSGDFDYLEPYYERALAMQDEGLQQTFGTATTGSLHHSSEFGRQRAAMVPMGTWFSSQLLTQIADGEADEFAWGIAPVPQYDDSTTGLDNTPVTIGGPTGMAINARIDEAKVEAAKEFLAYAAGEEGAQVLAGLGLSPALVNDTTLEAMLAVDGMPQDDLSAFALSTAEVKQENPVDPNIAQIQTILSALHTEVMPGAASVDQAISTAESRVANEIQD